MNAPELPDREDVLRFLDLEIQERSRLHWLMHVLDEDSADLLESPLRREESDC